MNLHESYNLGKEDSIMMRKVNQSNADGTMCSFDAFRSTSETSKRVCNMRKNSLMISVALAWVFAHGACATPMNVLFVAIDDLNDWVGCFGGNAQVKTPHLDRLNADGGGGHDECTHARHGVLSVSLCAADRRARAQDRGLRQQTQPASRTQGQGPGDTAAVLQPTRVSFGVHGQDLSSAP